MLYTLTAPGGFIMLGARKVIACLKFFARHKRPCGKELPLTGNLGAGERRLNRNEILYTIIYGSG